MNRRSKTVLFVLLAAMILSAGCRLPFTLKSEPTPAPAEPAPVIETPAEMEQTVPEESQQQPEPLPPVLVKVDPLPGSIIRPDQGFTFIFNQAVSKESVAAALHVDVETEIALDWLDEQTLFMTLADPLPADERITFTLDAGLQAENGLSSATSQEVQYQTAGPLRLVDQYPRPDAGPLNPVGVLMVAFNQPVVPLGGDSELAAFRLEPQAEGKGEWLNTSTYIFTPDPALESGVEYTVTLNQELTSQAGSVLALGEDQPAQWSFTTLLPQLLMIEPDAAEEISLEPSIVLTFNQAMDPAAVIAALQLLDEQGENVPLEIEWNQESTVFTLQPVPLLQRESRYTLQLNDSASSIGGSGLPDAVAETFTTVGNLEVRAIEPSLQAPFEIFSGYASMQIQFNAPLGELSFEDFIRFEPALLDPAIYLADDRTLVVSGYFSGSAAYTLTIDPTLQDRWGGALGSPYTASFTTTPSRPQLSIPLLQYGANVLFMTPEDPGIAAQVVNIPAVNLSAETLSLDSFIEFAAFPEQILPYFTNAEMTTWQQDISTADEQLESVLLELDRQGAALTPGIYLYGLDAPGLEIAPQPFMLVVSNLQVTLKRSEEQLFAWIVDLRSGMPAADKPFALYTATGIADNCTTDADGRCVFVLPEDMDPYASLVVAGGQPGEEDFTIGMDRWTMGLSGWDFGLTTYRTQEDTFAYVYTDRPIYRPGQEVHFRVVVREQENARYNLPDLGQIHLDVYGDYEVTTGEVPLLESIPLSLSAYGSSTGTFLLPEDASPGYYSVRIREIEDSFLSFTVAEYRKPEIDLQVNFSRDQWLAGADLSAQVQAEYYFGAPAAGTPVHWALYTQPDQLSMPFGYQTGLHDFAWLDMAPWSPGFPSLGALVAEGNADTDDLGNIDLQIAYETIRSSLEAGGRQRLALEVTIRDESEHPVSARGESILNPEEYYIGVRTEQWSGNAGAPLGFAIQTSGWDQSAYPGVAMTAVLQKIRWVPVRDPVSGFLRSEPEYSQVSGVELTSDSQGQARIELTPGEPGTYLLAVSSGGARTEVMVWVGGAGSVSWPNLPNQQLPLTLDQERYQVGDTALLFIPNPFEKALALITVERANVVRSYVQEINQPSLNYPLQILAEDAPNIYVGVTLINIAGDELDFRQGYASLPVDPDALTLEVSMAASHEQPLPGEDVILSLLVTDSQGNPVEGEFTVSVVDKAVLALVEPNAAGIVEAFFGLQSLGVQTSLSLAAYVGRFPRPDANGIGGGGGAELQAPALRQDFRDTAFWSGIIQTDSLGRVDIPVALPDNLTTWVVQARGLTLDTRVGEAQIELVASKDLLVRPIVPRFLVSGDEVEFGAVVHNNTTESLPVDIALQVSGIGLSAETPETLRIILDAGSQQRVNWSGVVQGVDAVEMVFSASSGTLSDTTTPEGGAIEVLHYLAPQTFGTSGVLIEQSEVLEVISLPVGDELGGGSLTVELAPSLAAAILEEIEALEAYPHDFTEAILSRMLPNLKMLDAVQTFGLDSAARVEALSAEIRTSIDHLSRLQDGMGGWGWTAGAESDPFISSYVLFGLSLASQQGFFVDPAMIAQAQDYLLQALPLPASQEENWQFERLVFQYYSLFTSGIGDVDSNDLVPYLDRLNPWARALLYLMQVEQYPGNETMASAQNGLASLANQTATGVSWANVHPSPENFSSTILNTAVSIYALAKIDPASSLLSGGVRYLMVHRKASGSWSSSYESAWVLSALIDAMKASGELQADFAYSVRLNTEELLSGTAEGVDSLTAVTAVAPFERLFAGAPNALRVRKEAGTGRLYYRAYLQAYLPAQEAEAIDRGISVERQYRLWQSNCSLVDCPVIEQYSLSGTDSPVLVQISITVPEDMYYVVVEDWLPAGAEIADPNLLTAEQGSAGVSGLPAFSSEGYVDGGWYFEAPQIHDEHIRWVAQRLSAGTYVLTYRFSPYLAGIYQVIPARAYQYYFPEVEGSSPGTVFNILP